MPASKTPGVGGGSASRRIGVLISGRGSNLMAILDHIAAGDLDAEVVLVISNVAQAAGLRKASERGVS